jgi:hypothetical protein
MPQPPSTPVISRELVRVIPFAAEKTFAAVVANLGTMVAEFDVGASVTDVNQFIVGSFPGVSNPQRAVGPWLDALIFSPVAGTLLVEFAVDTGTAYRSIATSAVAASVASNISGLRITGRFVRVTFTNTSGGGSVINVEFGIYVRSS